MANFIRATPRSAFNFAFLSLCGVASAVLYGYFGALRVPDNPSAVTQVMQSFGTIVVVLFLVFIGAVLVVRRIIRTDSLSPNVSLAVILGFAVLIRLLLLPQTPFLSNDIYRYLWDARALDHGINPYLYPPEARELFELRDTEVYEKMSHKEVRTVYPPVLQFLFWGAVKIASVFSLNPMYGLKALFVLFDLLLLLLLIKIFFEYHIDPRWAILYAWHPLSVIEIASSGHTDGIGAFFLLAALYFLKREQHLHGATLLALAFLVKFITVLLLPFVFFFSRLRERKKFNWSALLVFFVVGVLCYLPFMGAGDKLFSGLSVYSAKWRFNDAIFSLFFAPLTALIPDWLVVWLMIPPDWQISAEALITRRVDLVLVITKTIMAVIFALFYFRLWYSARAQARVHEAINWPQSTLAILTVFFLLSPTLQSWYLLWILPLLGISLGQAYTFQRTSVDRNQSKLAHFEHFLATRFKIYLWLLSGTIFLSYWVLEAYWRESIWQEQAWVKWVEFGLPCLVFFLPERYLRLDEVE